MLRRGGELSAGRELAARDVYARAVSVRRRHRSTGRAPALCEAYGFPLRRRGRRCRFAGTGPPGQACAHCRPPLGWRHRSASGTGCAFPKPVLASASDTSARPASLAAAVRQSSHGRLCPEFGCARQMRRDGSEVAKRRKRRLGHAAASEATAVSGSRLSPAPVATRRDRVASDPAPRRAGRIRQFRQTSLTSAARQSSWPRVSSGPVFACSRSAGDRWFPNVRRIGSSRSAETREQKSILEQFVLADLPHAQGR